MSETSVRRVKKSKVKSVLYYIVGSIALCAVAFIVIPKVVPYISGAINKKMAKINNANKSEDDWGPVIVKKSSEKSDEEE